MTNKIIPTVDEAIVYMSSLPRRTRLFRDMDIRLLRIVQADLNRVLDLRESELVTMEDNERARQSKINEHLEQLKKDGIYPKDLVGATRTKKKPSIGPIRTYRVDGVLMHYKGVGRYALKLQQIIDEEGLEGLEKYEVDV